MSGGVQTSGSMSKLLVTGIRKVITQVYKQHTIFYDKLYHTVESDKAWEEFLTTSGYPLAQDKSEGGGITYVRQTQGFTTRVKPKTVALGTIVTFEEQQDNLYINALKRAALLEISFIQKMEYDAHYLLANATSGAITYGDGQPLCSASHPLIGLGGGTFSNLLPTAAPLSEAAVEDMSIQIGLAINADGYHMVFPKDKLIVQTSQEFNAARLYKTMKQPGNNNNDVNALLATSNLPELVVTPYLPQANPWYITTKLPSEEQGLILVRRKSPPDVQDNDADTRNWKMNRVVRYMFSVVDTPVAIFMSNAA